MHSNAREESHLWVGLVFGQWLVPVCVCVCSERFSAPFSGNIVSTISTSSFHLASPSFTGPVKAQKICPAVAGAAAFDVLGISASGLT